MTPNLAALLSRTPGRFGLLGVVAFAFIAIWPTWPSLLRVWLETADYEHGLVVAPISAIWLYRASRNLPAMSTRPSPGVAALLLVALCGWLVAYKAGSAIGEQIMAPAILALAVWMACGRAVALRVGPPILFLYCAIPAWEVLLPALRAGTIWASGVGLGWLNTPVTISGDLVTIPEGQFQIVDGCAGKRFLLICITIAASLAAALHMPWKRTLGFLAISAGIAILGNWLRVITIIYVGHVTNMQHYLVAREHISFGWGVYAVLCIIISYIGHRLAGPPVREERAPAPPAQPSSPARTAVVTTLALMTLAPAAMAYSDHLLPPASAAALQAPIVSSGLWTGPNSPDPAWNPVFRDADSQMHASYRSGEDSIEVFMARYLRQHQGVELIHEGNSLLGSTWHRRGEGYLIPPEVASDAPDIRLIRAVDSENRQWLITYVYQVGDVTTGSGARAQLAYGLGSWTRNRPASVLSAAMRCPSSCETAWRDLLGFWNSHGLPLLEESARD